MSPKQAVILAVTFVLAALAGFRVSARGGIQPGYFEKQEAPAYGVAKDKPLGRELGKEFEEHYRELYNEP